MSKVKVRVRDKRNVLKTYESYKEAAKAAKVPYITFYMRVYQGGWSVKEALETPVRAYKSHKPVKKAKKRKVAKRVAKPVVSATPSPVSTTVETAVPLTVD